MKDKNIQNLTEINRCLALPLRSLFLRNKEYSTWFSLWRCGNKTIVLELERSGYTESHAINFNVNIDDVVEMSESGWVSHASTLLGNKIHTLQ